MIKNAKQVSKNTEFDAKSLKNLMRKKLSKKNWQKNLVFDFNYCVQKFQPKTLFGDFICTFFKRFKLTHKNFVCVL